MKDHRKPKPLCQCVQRKCMKCHEMFMSEGNWICENCQRKNKSLSVLGGKYRPAVGRGKMVED